jgi:hypothetical protein
MKNIIYTLIIIVSFVSCKSAKKCLDFKTGNFEYIDPKFSDWKVTRNDTLQIETNIKNGIIVEGNVKWKSDYEYELIYIKTSHPQLQNMIGKKVEVSITNVNNDTITYFAKGIGKQMESKMIKIDD